MICVQISQLKNKHKVSDFKVVRSASFQVQQQKTSERDENFAMTMKHKTNNEKDKLLI